MSSELVVTVHGTPAPQGSKRHVGRGVMVESSAKVRPWREAVRHAAEDAATTNGWHPDPDAPLTLYVTFTLPRPTSHWRTGRNTGQLRTGAPTAPATMPDLDKLIRSTLDALVDAGTLTNDSRITHISADKTYPAGHLDALDTPGAIIILTQDAPHEGHPLR